MNLDHEKPFIHQIWIGPEKSAIIRECMQSVRDMNPEFEYMEWNEKNFPKFDYQDIIDQSQSPRESSDIMRIEIVRNYGGIYLDSDMLCLKPLYPLWNIAGGSFSVMAETAMMTTRELNVISACFAANEHEPWMEKAFNAIPQIFHDIGDHHDDCPYQCAHDVATRNFQKYGRTLYPEKFVQWKTDDGVNAYLIHIGQDSVNDPQMLQRVRRARITGCWQT